MGQAKNCYLKYSLSLCLSVLTGLFLFSACSEQHKKNEHTSITVRSGTNYRDVLRKADDYMSKSEFDSALKYYSQANDMLKAENNQREYIKVLLKQFDALRSKGNSTEASRVIEQAQQLLLREFPGDQVLQADILHRKGLLLLDRGSFDSSTLIFNLSIQTRIKATSETDTSLALTYNGLGTISFYRRKYDEALNYYSKAYTLSLNRKNPEDADLARYQQNMGIIYAQNGDYIKAESALTNSLRINEKISLPDDPELAINYLNMGRFLALMNKDPEALSYYTKSEIILQKKVGSTHPDIGSLYQNMGQAYIHTADYERALIFFNKALAIATVNYEPGHPTILSINMNIGYVYEKKKDYKNALDYYERSLPKDINNQAAIKTYTNMASLYSAMNQPEKANEYYNKSLELALKLLGEDHPETGLLYTRYGYFLMQIVQMDKGLEMVRKALDISIKNYGQKSREVSNNLTHIGNYYLIKNDLNKALSTYQDAIIAYVADFNNTDISANPPITSVEPDRYLVNALNGKAEALSLSGSINDLKNSLETYKLAIKAVEKLRSTYQNEESKLLLSEDERKTFLNTVKVSSILYKQTGNKEYFEEAFRYSDKGKSAVLFASLQDIEARQFSSIPKVIQDIEKKIKLDLGSYQRYTYEERQKVQPDEAKLRFWESKIFEFETKYDSLTKVLEKEYPDYYSIKYKEPDVSIEKIESQLEPGRVVIEYTLTDTLLYIFVIKKGKSDLITHIIDSSFFKNISTLRDATISNDLMSIKKDDYDKYTKAAYALYNDLLKPCLKIVNEKKLIIIPDSEISYISFDMLLDAAPDLTVMDFRTLPYLIRNYVISYSASATFQFSGLKTSRKKATENLLAMAPSYENLTYPKKVGFTDGNGKTVYLLPIPGVEDEIKSIKKSLSGKTISGQVATEKKFKEIAGKYNILHLAMHTLVNNEKPMLSKLVFYQDNDSLEDGMLNTYELFSMNLNAGLAVLSACNTGSGKLMKGEGLMNLARGFIYAGVPGIVMTMWAVEDQSSAEIVQKFYEYLEDGMTKDEALRQAKLDLIKQGDPLRSHPYYWAAYVTIGDYSPMKFIKPMWVNILFGIIGFLSIAGLLLLFRDRKRQKNVLIP